jgi:hypothetical protein
LIINYIIDTYMGKKAIVELSLYTPFNSGGRQPSPSPFSLLKLQSFLIKAGNLTWLGSPMLAGMVVCDIHDALWLYLWLIIFDESHEEFICTTVCLS